MFKQYQHLLPRGRAFNTVIDKVLRRLFVALGTVSEDLINHVNLIGSDLIPRYTRRLTLWERQFNLADSGLTDDQRRERLRLTWRAIGGQSPDYIQTTLQNAGFIVYVHEWFDSSGTARNPNLIIRDDGDAIVYSFELGTTGAELGTTAVELGQRSNAVGYLLVNKIFDNSGNRINYEVPDSSNDWPFILYIGGAVFPDSATIDSKRRDEFEELLLSISPGQQWLGVLIEYGAE